MRTLRFRGRRHDESARSPSEDDSQVIQIDVGELSAVFAAPRWLRDLGLASWFVVGVAALLVGLVLLLGATSAITQPVLAAFVVACVASPLVGWLQLHGVPRAAGAALVLLGLVSLAVLMIILVIGGISSQSDEIGSTAGSAADKVQGWLEDAGVDSSGAASANDATQDSVSTSVSTFLHGIVNGIESLASVALGLSFAALSLFFLLKDGPSMRGWVDRNMGVEEPVARTITSNVIVSLRRYFGGVTIVAAFNAVVVGIGAIVLGVPLAGTIALISFVTAYIPYIGAFVAGAFAVVLTLGSEGTTEAIIMLVIVLLANGLLQNILQPIAFGATLGLNPLVVLIVTVGAGALFGMVGLVLAAPLTSAAVHISAELARAKAEARRKAQPETEAGSATPAEVPGGA
ncbi:MAG: AI-2E family transporter [Gaiella sp.]|nr:AI-2E family transporter [Gaiella sp.]